MNFALLVSNLPDVYQVQHSMPVSWTTTLVPFAFKRAFFRLFPGLQGH
jgi:hypothetical protein